MDRSRNPASRARSILPAENTNSRSPTMAVLAVKLIVNCLLCNCEQWRLKGEPVTSTPDLSSVNYTGSGLCCALTTTQHCYQQCLDSINDALTNVADRIASYCASVRVAVASCVETTPVVGDSVLHS